MSNPALAIGIPAAVMAHQGGWDEILLVVGPMAVVAGLLALARRRVQKPAVSDERAEGAHRSPPQRGTTTR